MENFVRQSLEDVDNDWDKEDVMVKGLFRIGDVKIKIRVTTD